MRILSKILYTQFRGMITPLFSILPEIEYLKMESNPILEKKNCNFYGIGLLLLGRKATTNLDGVLKSRDTTLPTKVCLVKAMVFPVVMHGCESWTIKKAEHKIDAFELWCWRTLESPLDYKEIQPVHPKGDQS